VAERDSSAGTRQFAGLEWYTLAEWQNGARRFVVCDTTNTVRDVLDSQGGFVWRGSFEAYGLTRREEGARVDRQRFPGQYSDAESGLAYNFYRHYDPALASYLTPDPTGLKGGADHYGYPRNPFFWFDPFGLHCPAHKAEDNMDAHFDNLGYDKVGPLPAKNLNTPGIDGVYRARPGFGPPEFIIGEAKSSQSGRLGNTQYSGQQMSNQWLNTGVGGSGPDRLTSAVGVMPATLIQNSARADPNSVSKVVFHQPGGTGTPTVTPAAGPGAKPYDPDSMTGTY
jgi:RHS repeat-associated protein